MTGSRNRTSKGQTLWAAQKPGAVQLSRKRAGVVVRQRDLCVDSLVERLCELPLRNRSSQCFGSCANLVGMLKLLLICASLLSAQEASMDCAAAAATRTRAVRGPSGVAAVLKVLSGDDGSKDFHNCRAEYQLLVRPANGGAAAARVLFGSNANWGRRLSLHLDGFSRDGRHVFGILAEGGRYSLTEFFDYDTSSGKVKLVDLRKYLTQLKAVKCGVRYAVAGTIDAGAVVLEPDAASQCRGDYRWVLNPTTGELQRLPPGKTCRQPLQSGSAVAGGGGYEPGGLPSFSGDLEPAHLGRACAGTPVMRRGLRRPTSGTASNTPPLR